MDQKRIKAIALEIADIKDKQKDIKKTLLDPLSAKEKELRKLIQKLLKQANKTRIDIPKRYTITRYEKVNHPKFTKEFMNEVFAAYLSKHPNPSVESYVSFFFEYRKHAAKKKETLRISRASVDKPDSVSQTLVVGDET